MPSPSREIPVTNVHPEAVFIDVVDRHSEAQVNGSTEVSLFSEDQIAHLDRQPGDANLNEAIERFSPETNVPDEIETAADGQPSKSLARKVGTAVVGLAATGAVTLAIMNSPGDADAKKGYQEGNNKRAGIEQTDR